MTIAKKLVKKTVSIAKSDCESIVKIRLLQRIHLPIVKIISISSIKNDSKSQPSPTETASHITLTIDEILRLKNNVMK